MKAACFTIIGMLCHTALQAGTPLRAENGSLDSAPGNSAIEVIIPRVIPVIYAYVSPSAGDATLVLRITTLITHEHQAALLADPCGGAVLASRSRTSPGQAFAPDASEII